MINREANANTSIRRAVVAILALVVIIMSAGYIYLNLNSYMNPEVVDYAVEPTPPSKLGEVQVFQEIEGGTVSNLSEAGMFAKMKSEVKTDNSVSEARKLEIINKLTNQ